MERKYQANISRERLRQLRRNARGLCFRSGCKGHHVKGGLCKTHMAESSERRKNVYAEKKARKRA